MSEWRCPFCGKTSTRNNKNGSNKLSHAGLLAHIGRVHQIYKHQVVGFTMPRKGTRG